MYGHWPILLGTVRLEFFPAMFIRPQTQCSRLGGHKLGHTEENAYWENHKPRHLTQ